MMERALELVRQACEGLESWGETVKWGHDRVFQVEAKMFAVLGEWRAS